MNKTTGLLGGTFNPVHNGHLDLGLQLIETFRLHQIYYILSANPPHKHGGIVPAPLRWKMLQKALAPHPALVPSDLEMRSTRPSWTIDTVRKLKSSHPADRLFFICGSEGFLQIQTWKNYRDLLAEIPFIVVLRDRSHQALITRLAREENQRMTAAPEKDADLVVYPYTADSIDLSSTRIRQRIRRGMPVDHLVPPSVLKIIKEYKLYES